MTCSAVPGQRHSQRRALSPLYFQRPQLDLTMHMQALAADLEAASASAALATATQETAAAALRDTLLLQEEEYARSLQLQVCQHRWHTQPLHHEAVMLNARQCKTFGMFAPTDGRASQASVPFQR